MSAELANGAGPGHWRSATSRAYYAVFNVGTSLLRPIVPIAREGKAHSQVWRVLSNCSNDDLRELGSDLADLHARRIDADYELDNKSAERQATVKATVAEAGEMIRILEQVLQSAGSQAIMKSIQQYWTQILREPLRGCKPIP